MNVGELLRERERLLGVMEEAKAAKGKLRQVNLLIAMYSGNDEKVELINSGAMLASEFCLFGDGKPVKNRGICSTHYYAMQRGALSDAELAMIPASRTGAHSRKKKS
jgi:hypothetical protein